MAEGGVLAMSAAVCLPESNTARGRLVAHIQDPGWQWRIVGLAALVFGITFPHPIVSPSEGRLGRRIALERSAAEAFRQRAVV